MKVEDKKYDGDLFFPSETVQRVVKLDRKETYEDALKHFSPDAWPRPAGYPFDERAAGIGTRRGVIGHGIILAFDATEEDLELIDTNFRTDVFRRDECDPVSGKYMRGSELQVYTRNKKGYMESLIHTFENPIPAGVKYNEKLYYPDYLEAMKQRKER